MWKYTAKAKDGPGDLSHLKMGKIIFSVFQKLKSLLEHTVYSSGMLIDSIGREELLSLGVIRFKKGDLHCQLISWAS